MTTAGVVTWSGMETKSIVKPYGNNISVAFPLGMYILNVGKVSVALAYTNIGVLSLLHKREQVCFDSPEMHLKSRVSLTNCIMKLFFRKISVWHLQGSVPLDNRGILIWGQRQHVRIGAMCDSRALKVLLKFPPVAWNNCTLKPQHFTWLH